MSDDDVRKKACLDAVYGPEETARPPVRTPKNERNFARLPAGIQAKIAERAAVTFRTCGLMNPSGTTYDCMSNYTL